MHLVGNALNGYYFDNLSSLADDDDLEGIVMAVAYVRDIGPIIDVARKRAVPVTLYALADEGGFPSLDVLRMFVNSSPPSWQIFLTRRFYHPKIVWFRGIGCYIGSANLTDGGRVANLECGVWLDEDDLRQQNLDNELASMIGVIRGRSTPATKEDITRFELIQRARGSVSSAQRELARLADKELGHIKGQDTPQPWTKAGGAARAKFIEDWDKCLTLLRKLGDTTSKMPRPPWVETDVAPAIAFDQATEYFYTKAVRKSGRKRDEVVNELFLANRRNPDAAVRKVLEEWAEFDGHEGTWEWPAWCNEHPRKLRELLSSTSLAALNENTLCEILWLTHAAHEHGRQIKNHTLGLPAGTEMDVHARCEVYARYLLGQRSVEGKSVGDVLHNAIWGDAQQVSAAARVWEATRNKKWCLPHLGPSILGEMIGYARPMDYPPRNQRVVRTLIALGYDGLVLA